MTRDEISTGQSVKTDGHPGIRPFAGRVVKVWKGSDPFVQIKAEAGEIRRYRASWIREA
jgi:hypothetical protein